MRSQIFAFFSVVALVAGLPMSTVKPRAGTACAPFALLDYSAFQISDGTAGTAQTQANAAFPDHFTGCDLSTVDATSLQNIQTMREAAESAETDDFNPQIAAATGAAATALQNGKIKNKVLKLTAEVLGLQIQAAQGADKASDIATEQKKLTTNIGLDTKAAGQPSQGVA
ncbi:hypothetical protein FRB94_005949 [Tulasnella sp. JGI-2019a]|nr:hypothetical protein FRB93_006581 [Tulasnella sp. JGI-2019a]KAG8999775.1 hypothetical protein FRB94_005949 [Tulasnella sp. JGI-2019a]KAG9026826.1 hypothetical protein FRB95_008406 [Tulasnella sp. JGI-2019a]